MRKYQIEVREKGIKYGEPGKLIKTVSRTLIAEAIGNFNPIFCRYNNDRYLVSSLAGDLSDPFRREESYSDSFYIEI